MTNPLLKAAGITPETPGHETERALFGAAWQCVAKLRYSYDSEDTRICCVTKGYRPHEADCPLVAFDEAAKVFQEDV